MLSYLEEFVNHYFKRGRISSSHLKEKRELHKENLSDLHSRIFQHEYDHMQGLDFTKMVSKLRLDIAKKRQRKQVKKSMFSKT